MKLGSLFFQTESAVVFENRGSIAKCFPICNVYIMITVRCGQIKVRLGSV